MLALDISRTSSNRVLGYFGLRGVLEKPPVITNKRIPSIVFCVYQLMFAAFTLVYLFAESQTPLQAPLTAITDQWSLLVQLQSVHALDP